MGYLFKFIRWLGEKFAAAILIVALGLFAGGLWLFLRDNVDFDQWRHDLMRSLTGERAKVQTALGEVQQRMGRMALELRTEQDRALQADRVVAQLEELASTWDKLIGNPGQQQANEEQLRKMKALQGSLASKIQTLQEAYTHATWERDGLEIALGRLDTRLASVERQQSRLLHYLRRTWDYPLGRSPWVFPVKTWVGVALGLYFLGPTAGKLTLYFLLAPIIMRGRPVRLEAALGALPLVGLSEAATELILAEGECGWVKERFIQGSDEGLRRRTKYLLDWRLPLTCLATGLVELIEVAPRAGTGTQRLTLAHRGDPQSELAVVTLPKGAALVLRPSFLAGVVLAPGAQLLIRPRWQWFRWQAWATLQFRFFEFLGPCRLIVAGSRGVQAERLEEGRGPVPPARRTHQDATIGFTPNLDYRPVRAETFWSYYRGTSPLFDDLFTGPGVFLCQRVAMPGEARQARRFWAGVWSGVMKIFGL